MPNKRGPRDTDAYFAALRELRKNPNATAQDLAELTGYSETHMKRQMERIESEGSIPGYKRRQPGRPPRREQRRRRKP